MGLKGRERRNVVLAGIKKHIKMYTFNPFAKSLFYSTCFKLMKRIQIFEGACCLRVMVAIGRQGLGLWKTLGSERVLPT